MDNEDITIENIVAYKMGYKSVADIEQTIDDIDKELEQYECTLKVGKSFSDEAKEEREKFHPITNGKIRVELAESQNDLTQIKLDVKAHCTEEFYIDITLSGANNGGIYNKVFFE